MLRLLTGRNRALGRRFCARWATPLKWRAGRSTWAVPKQLTLETELFLLEGLSLQGSFRLRVLSPERLCGLIFDAAGRPEGARVDDRGRGDARLPRHEGAGGRTDALPRRANAAGALPCGAAKQVEIFRQAGMAPEDVRACAAGGTGLPGAQAGGRGRHTRRL